MKKKNYGTVLVSILLVGAVVGWTIFNSTPEPQPAVEYRAVCRGLPTNAHWTDGSTRKEIPQTETSPNVREPSPVGTYGTSTGATECHFVCDDRYERKNGACEASGGITYDPNAGTITITDGTTTYTIMDRNLGATIAGTGRLYNSNCSNYGNGGNCRSESIGDYFQRGNNYGFANSGTLSTSSNLVPNAIAYGPSSYYSGSTFITQSGVESASNYDYWTGGQNNNLRGGSGDTRANGRDSGNARIDRKGPCPDGYHVPSAGEWGGLVATWWNVTSGDFSSYSNDIYYDDNNGLPYIDYCRDDCSAEGIVGRRFMDDFLLPLAGYRYYDSSATVYSQGYSSYYWSSSPNGSRARDLYLDTFYVRAYDYYGRANGFSLRCFKDS